jgi:CDP-diglyceride synthetase
MMSPAPYTGWIWVVFLILALGMLVAVHLLEMLRRQGTKPERKLGAVLVLTPLSMTFFYLWMLRPFLVGMLTGFYKACPVLHNIDAYVDVSLSIIFVAVYVLVWQDRYYRIKAG